MLLLKYAVFVVVAYIVITVIHFQLKGQVVSYFGAHPRRAGYYGRPGGNDTQCEAVHVATYCNDVDSTRDVVSMVHTLLYRRTSPLHLHLIVSYSSKRTLKLLFDTWQLPNVTLIFYPESAIQQAAPPAKKTDDVHNILSKLPVILPRSVSKVVYASRRIRFLDDVTQLWRAFDVSEIWEVSLALNTEFGLPHVLKPGRMLPPTAYLYDLAVLNVLQFRKKWNLQNPEEFEKLSLDQDIRPEVVVPLSCSWSVQLDVQQQKQPQQRVNTSHCVLPLQGVVWSANFMGSALLENTEHRVLEVRNSNGDLQRTAFLCGGIHTETMQRSNDLTAKCAEYSYAFDSKRRVHLNFLGAVSVGSSIDDAYDVTLATQFSADRLYMFEKFAQNWDGPIVAVIHASDAEAMQLGTGVQQSKILKKRKNIAYHVVYKRQYYPINFLRNLGLNQTQTPYVIFVDVDLIPMPAMYPLLKTRLKELADSKSDMLLPVIPAFEAFGDLPKFPQNKTDLLQFVKKGNVDGYRVRKGWKLGHKATNYPKWKTTNTSYVVKWEDAFEPYVVLSTKNLPLYNEQLLERMGDKIAYGLQLYAMGYDFLILTDAFVIHLPHPPSDGTNVWKHSPTYSRCGSRLFQAYKAQLRKEYPKRKI